MTSHSSLSIGDTQSRLRLIPGKVKSFAFFLSGLRDDATYNEFDDARTSLKWDQRAETQRRDFHDDASKSTGDRSKKDVRFGPIIARRKVGHCGTVRLLVFLLFFKSCHTEHPSLLRNGLSILLSKLGTRIQTGGQRPIFLIPTYTIQRTIAYIRLLWTYVN